MCAGRGCGKEGLIGAGTGHECGVRGLGPYQLQPFQPEHYVYGWQSTSVDLDVLAWFVLFCTVVFVLRMLARLLCFGRRRGSAQGSVEEMVEVLGGKAGLMVCLDVGLAW